MVAADTITVEILLRAILTEWIHGDDDEIDVYGPQQPETKQSQDWIPTTANACGWLSNQSREEMTIVEMNKNGPPGHSIQMFSTKRKEMDILKYHGSIQPEKFRTVET